MGAIWLGDSYDPKVFPELLADISLFYFLGFLGFLYRKWTRNVGDSYEQEIFQELFADISLLQFSAKSSWNICCSYESPTFLVRFLYKEPKKPRKKKKGE